jgi:ribosomal protein L40E
MSKTTFTAAVDLPFDLCFRLVEENGQQMEGYKKTINESRKLVWKWGTLFGLLPHKVPGSTTVILTPVGLDSTLLEVTIERQGLIDALNQNETEFNSFIGPFFEKARFMSTTLEASKNISAGLLCPKCGKSFTSPAKFCSNCRTLMLINCSICNATNSPEAKYCSTCGAALGKNCSICGTMNSLDAKFCGKCGNPYSA